MVLSVVLGDDWWIVSGGPTPMMNGISIDFCLRYLKMIMLFTKMFMSLLYVAYEGKAGNPVKCMLIIFNSVAFHFLYHSFRYGSVVMKMLAMTVVLSMMYAWDSITSSIGSEKYSKIYNAIVHPYYKKSLREAIVSKHYAVVDTEEFMMPMMMASMISFSCNTDHMIISMFGAGLVYEYFKEYNISLVVALIPTVMGAMVWDVGGFTPGMMVLTYFTTFLYYLMSGSSLIKYTKMKAMADRAIDGIMNMRHCPSNCRDILLNKQYLVLEYIVNDNFDVSSQNNSGRCCLKGSSRQFEYSVNTIWTLPFELLACRSMCTFKSLWMNADEVSVGGMGPSVDGALSLISKRSAYIDELIDKDASEFTARFPTFIGTKVENDMMQGCLEAIDSGKAIIVIKTITNKVNAFLKHMADRSSRPLYIVTTRRPEL